MPEHKEEHGEKREPKLTNPKTVLEQVRNLSSRDGKGRRVRGNLYS